MSLPDLNLRNAKLLAIIEGPDPISLIHFVTFAPFYSKSLSRV